MPTTASNETDWSALYESLLPCVYNFFRYRFGDDQHAQDLTSQTFERAWRYRSSYRQDAGAFSSWLFKVARNIAADDSTRRFADLPLDAIAGTSDCDGAGRAETLLQTQRLFKLLATMQDRERDLIALKYGGELTNREIAEITGLSESNVGTILHRAKSSLRIQWETQHER